MANINVDPSDLLRTVANGLNDASKTAPEATVAYLKSIDSTLRQIAGNGKGSFTSQSAARDSFSESRRSTSYSSSRFRPTYGQGFIDEFEKAVVEGFLGKDFKSRLKQTQRDFLNQFDFTLKDLQSELGKQLGKQAVAAFKNTDFGKTFTSNFDTIKAQASQKVNEYAKSSLSNLKGKNASQAADYLINSGRSMWSAAGGAKGIADKAKSAGMAYGPEILRGLSSGLGGAAKGAIHLAKAFPALGLALVGATAGILLLKAAAKNLSLGFGGVKKIIGGFLKAGNRYEESRKQNVKLAQQRLEQDVRTLVETPFKILEDAANKVYQTWDQNLKTINGTQLYTKADLQDLMSSFANRLRRDNLTDAVAGTDITSGLTKVLSSGLTGKIAEEFAYQAVKLNAAVPTQDFFGYAPTYASIAANATRAGMSQAQAIEAANKSLEQFTSGLLYAQRELTQGFTTGLLDAKSLYDKSVRIAQAARSSDMSQIAGVLLAVSGQIGAVAPDLASSLVDTVYRAATGGNSPDVVALRSLAGTNASNTEFLRAFAANPQKVFATLFRNLDKMYGSSDAAYMEKAEGYGELFGLSREAFQRINFKDLASAISNMQMTSTSLDENLKHLASGQTVTSAEQLRNRQINKYLIEEGLSLTLDNEAGRAIQQHMWQEQLSRQMMEATYAVELKGAAAEGIEMIQAAVRGIYNLLNPVSWFKKAAQAIGTTREIKGHEKDIRQVLQLGKVGNVGALQMYQLTTRNRDHNLVPNLVNMLGGQSQYALASRTRNNIDWLLDGGRRFTEGGSMLSHHVSKSYAKSLDRTARKATNHATVRTKSGKVVKSASAGNVQNILSGLLTNDNIVNNYIRKGKGYDDWKAAATSAGISDVDQAIADSGYSEKQIKKHFLSLETSEGMSARQAEAELARQFRERAIQFYDADFPNEYRDPLFELFRENNQSLKDIIGRQDAWKQYFKTEWLEKGWAGYFSASSGSGLFNKFYQEFMKYFVNHVYYSNTPGYSYRDVEYIKARKKRSERGDTVYALAEMLTKNLVDLKDPTVQTNAILSQILIVVNAIMNQNNDVKVAGGSGLVDALSAMALGLTKQGQ